MTKESTYKLALSAMFLALGMVLPFFTGQIQQIGNFLLPMHIPVFLCAFMCGAHWGGAVGISTPILRSVCFGMPVFYPSAIAMALELAVYGAVAGLIYRIIRRKSIWAVYASMLPAMLLGRLVWGAAQLCLLGARGVGFSFGDFVAGAFVNALPGIILQLVLVPAVITLLASKGYINFRSNEQK